MMNRYFFEAWQELKRADHLIYVSLKYTRTVDVINNIIKRLINTFDFLMEGILEKAKNDEKITAEIKIPGLKCEKLRELYKDDAVFNDYLDFYLLLRKMKNSPQTKASEFRRGVMMGCIVDGKEIEVTIDIITDYYKRMMDLMEHIKENQEKFLDLEE